MNSLEEGDPMGSPNGAKTVLFVADPPAALNPRGDSTLALAEAALVLGYQVHWTTPQQISLHGHHVEISPVAALKGLEEALPRSPHSPVWDFSVQHENRTLDQYSAIFIRKDPPFDSEYMSFCWMLALAFSRPEGTPIRCYNTPQSLLSYHEKTVQFAALEAGVIGTADVIPAVVTRKTDLVKSSLQHWHSQGFHEGFVIKPWLGYGGRGVHFAADSDAAFEIWVAENQNALQIVQPFDPLVHSTGDVRVILAREKIIGCFARKPLAGKIASNLAQGGTAHAYELSDHQQQLMKRVAKFLVSKGIVFAGVDLIGDRINEINITSPTGLRSIQALGNPQAHLDAFGTILEIQ